MAEIPNQEQLKALQEKIKQMSPEELKEFQKKQCIFCQIIAGKVQSKKVYEDDKVIAIFDINPANPGHTLLLTKEHYSIMPQIPDDEVAYLFMAVKALSNSMLRGIDAQGTNIIVANGVAAGQKAQHFMAHIIPRRENDGINFVLPQDTLGQNEIEEVGNKLIAALETTKTRSSKTESLSIQESCVVCQIIENKLPSKKIYEDEIAMAVLDVNGANPGHCFVIPKNHYPILEQVPDSEIGRLFQVSNKISSAIFESLGAQGTNLFVANGIPAGQTVAHFTINIIPRKDGDGINLQWQPKQLSEEETSTVELKLKDQTKNIGDFEKEGGETKKSEKPIFSSDKDFLKDDEDEYFTKQMRRLP